MGEITLEKAKEMCQLYLTAEEKILKGQSYSIGDRSLTRADLKDVVRERKYWCNLADQLSTGRTKPGVKRVLPRDN